LDRPIRALYDVRRLIPCGEALGEIPESRRIYQDVIQIAWPSVIEMVTMSMIGFMDTFLVSGLSEEAISAVGLCSQPRMLLMALFYALNVGVIAIVARRKGEGRQADANKTLRNAMMMIALFSFGVMALGLTFSPFLMRLAGAQPDTLVDSRAYFEITTWFLPVNTLTICICAAQRGVGNTRITLYVNIASNLVDLLFSWLLINGYWGLPRLEVAGAAWGTGVGFAVGFLMALSTVFGRRHGEGFFHLSLEDDWRPNFKILKEITDVGSGAVLEQVALRFGFFTYAAIVANLGTAVFAAHQICAQFQNLSFTFGDGIGVAGTSLVGQSLGRKRPDMAKLYGIASQRMAMTVALALAASIVVFRYPLVGIFTDDPYILNLAAGVMLLLAVFQPFQTSSVVVSGALRGAGDTKFVARVMMLCVGVMRPLLALVAVLLLSNVFGHPEIALMGAWAAAIIDMATRVTLVYRRFSGGKWCDIKV